MLQSGVSLPVVARQPAPWDLTGSGWVVALRMAPGSPLRDAFLPGALAGRGQGAIAYLMYVDYAESACGPYRELLFIPGSFPFADGRRHLTISRILVSTWDSVVNGRINWGIPKDRADFEVAEVLAGKREERIRVVSEGRELCDLRFASVPFMPSLPVSSALLPERYLTLAQHFGQVSMFAAPTMVRRLVDHVAEHAADCSGIKTLVYGGGPMYLADILRALAVLGDRLVQIYGQGESPMTISALSRHHLADRRHPRYLERIASVGVAHSVVEVLVADADGQPLPAGDPGEVLVRGETVMLGYWRNPEATAATLRDGWLYTGDIGSFDGDGFLTLKDRSKDVIISGGANIYPREVEEVLLRHTAVAEVCLLYTSPSPRD